MLRRLARVLHGKLIFNGPTSTPIQRRVEIKKMSRSNLTRRGFLAGLGVGIAGVALAACGGGAAAPTTAPAAGATTAATGTTPAAGATTAAAGTTPAAGATTAAAGTTPAAGATTAAAGTTPAAGATTAAAGTTPAAGATTAAAGTTPAAGATTAAAGTTPAAAPGAINTKVTGAVTWLVRTTIEENNGQSQVFEPLIKAQLPGLQVTRIVIPQDQYIPKINSMAAANESLEIWGFGGNYYDYWARNLPQNLDSYVAGDKWDINAYFEPGLPQIYTIHGHLYGLPQLTCWACNLVYNKTLFDAAGLAHPPMDYNDKTWTIDKMLQYATTLTKNYGAPDATYGVLVSIGNLVSSLAYLFGGDSWVPEHYTNFIAQKTNFNSPEEIAGHQWRQDLIYKQKVHPDPSAIAGVSQFANPFKTGKIGMVLDGGWQYWTTSDITEFKVGIAPIPWAKVDKNTIFDDFWIMGRWAKNKDGAWSVLRVLTSVEATTKYSVASGTPPTPRESTPAWAAKVADRIGEPVANLMGLLNSGIEKGRVQESPDHLFLQYPKIATTYDNESAALWNHADANAATVIPNVAKVMDQTVLDIYTQFKDSMPTN
jgi:multiple sugar transport system substrate-binding protein